MRRLTQAKLKEILTRGLKLRDPEFRLHTYASRISGSIIDPVFHRMDDIDRLTRIWDLLDKEFGPKEAPRLVGMLLAYSPQEWDVPRAMKVRQRKAG